MWHGIQTMISWSIHFRSIWVLILEEKTQEFDGRGTSRCDGLVSLSHTHTYTPKPWYSSDMAIPQRLVCELYDTLQAWNSPQLPISQAFVVAQTWAIQERQESSLCCVLLQIQSYWRHEIENETWWIVYVCVCVRHRALNSNKKKTQPADSTGPR